MSTFNTAQMQTDAMLAPLQMEAGRRRNEGIQYIGQAAASAAEQFNVARQREAQLQIQGAEATARIGAWSQEQALNQIKMQQVLALDQAMISRHGVTMAEVQANTAMMEYQQRAEAVKGSQVDHRQKQYEYALMAGLRLNDKTGEMEPFANEAEWSKAVKKFQAVNFKPNNYSPGLERSRLLSALREAQRSGNTALVEKIQREINDSEGITSGTPTEPPPPAATSGAPAAPQAQANAQPQGNGLSPTVNYVATQAFHSPVWDSSPTWGRLNVDEQTRAKMSVGVGRIAEMQLKIAKNNGRDIDPGRMHDFIMQDAETNPTSMVWLLHQAGDDERTIRLKLGVLFKGREEAVDWALKQIREGKK